MPLVTPKLINFLKKTKKKSHHRDLLLVFGRRDMFFGLKSLKLIHHSKAFYQDFNMFSLIKNYMSVIKNEKMITDDSVNENYETIKNIGGVLEEHRNNLVSCHNDLVPENILLKNNNYILLILIIVEIMIHVLRLVI